MSLFFRRRVTRGFLIAATIAGALIALGFSVDPFDAEPASAYSSGQKPTIVLVHGAFADASGWERVTERLQRDGFTVIAPANPLRSLSGDAAYIRAVLEQTPGPLVVVGHSYGGAVITNAAAGNPNVTALVYIDAFLPDVGEDALSLAGEQSQVPTAIEPMSFPPFGPNDIEFTIGRDAFRAVFAADVNPRTAAVMWAAQRPAAAASFGEPTTEAAWKTIPSWALIGRQDNVIGPDSLRFMAERANATIVEINSSHVPMISHPNRVVSIIRQAAEEAN